MASAFRRSLGGGWSGGSLARWARPVSDEVAAADDLQNVFGATHERDDVERGIERSTKQTLPANRSGHRCNSDQSTKKWYRTEQLAHDPALPVLHRLACDAHVIGRKQTPFRTATVSACRCDRVLADSYYDRLRGLKLFSLLALCVSLPTLASCRSAPPREGAAAEVHALTSAHTRVVWVQGDGSDPFAMGSQLALMAFDSDDGRGERAILAEPGSYVKPLLSPRGDRVVYSTHPDLGDPSVFVVGFDGTGQRRFDRGIALGVWEDPRDGGEWVYHRFRDPRVRRRTVTRVRLDEPSRRELVWNRGVVSFDTFQVSPDGSIAGGLFPGRRRASPTSRPDRGGNR